MEKKMGPGVGNNFFHIEKTDFKEQTLFCKIGSLFFVIFLFHTKQRTDTSDKNQVNEAVESRTKFFFYFMDHYLSRWTDTYKYMQKEYRQRSKQYIFIFKNVIIQVLQIGFMRSKHQ